MLETKSSGIDLEQSQQSSQPEKYQCRGSGTCMTRNSRSRLLKISTRQICNKL